MFSQFIPLYVALQMTSKMSKAEGKGKLKQKKADRTEGFLDLPDLLDLTCFLNTCVCEAVDPIWAMASPTC